MLTGHKIKKEIEKGTITISPFKPERLGPNSYDLALGSTLKRITSKLVGTNIPTQTEDINIDEPYILKPGHIYLGVTQELTKTDKYIPCIDGRSSIARLGMLVHYSAGFGDIGFANHWTLEISVAIPFEVQTGLILAQIYFFKKHGKVKSLYRARPKSHYAHISHEPQVSKL